MRGIIFLILLAVLSSNATAGWLAISQSNVGTSYIDPLNIHREGTEVNVPMLINLNKVEMFSDEPYLSLLLLREYDCAKGLMRVVSDVAYSNNMGKGKAVYRDTEPGNWDPVIPSLEKQDLWHLACG